MARFATSGKGLATAANSNLIEIRSAAQQRARILEVHLFAETAVAFVNPALFVSTVVGAGATASTIQKEDSGSGTPSVGVFTGTWTTAPTLAAVAVRRATIPATIGQGIIWIWPDSDPLRIPLGLSLVVRNDGVVGPSVTWVVVWDE